MNTRIAQFFATGDTSLLRQQSVVLCGHTYPFCHRVCDVRLEGGASVRICRCVTCDEAFAVPTEHSSDEPGVPWALCGERLLAWVLDEAECPSGEPTDWAEWL